MKKPVLVLAITALATFVMGWVAHRVYKNSTAVTIEQKQEAETPRTVVSPTVADSTQAPVDSSIFHQTNFTATEKKDSVIAIKKDTIAKKEIATDEDAEPKKEFKPSKSFDDFTTTQKFKGPFAKRIDFSTCSSGQLYKAETKKAIEKGINFAGRYAFAKISCGKDCYSCTITDLKTGKVYAGPHAVSGYKFKPDSRLLIVNPPDKDGFYSSCEVCDPEMWEWNGKRFLKVK